MCGDLAQWPLEILTYELPHPVLILTGVPFVAEMLENTLEHFKESCHQNHL